MVTSERILTSIPSTDIQRLAAPPVLIQRARPVWRHAFIDLCLICLGLKAAQLVIGDPAGLMQAAYISPLQSAMMITTIFAFSGTYQRHPSPLDIADTEGLMRGLICTGVLLGLLCSACRAVPAMNALLTGGLLVLLLVLQREITYSLSRSSHRDDFLGTVRSPFSDAHRQEIGTRAAPRSIPTQPTAVSFRLKRTLDVVIGTAMVILVLPLCLVVALVIKIDSRGPALIRQRRVGKNGVPFTMWKFRSMYSDVACYARSPVSDVDPRLTRFGRRLRRLSIDELPQLLNVLTGDMSLVGPRPEMPFIVEKYSSHERLRLLATPGITGLWQISPARARPIHENLVFDLFYVANRNIFLDLAILLRTLSAVVRGIGAT